MCGSSHNGSRADLRAGNREDGSRRSERIDHAAIILAGIELTHKLRKGQFNFSKLIKRSALSSDPWWAALVA
jgi:hypothetical protein